MERKKRDEKGKMINDLSEREQRARRKNWRRAWKRSVEKKKKEQSTVMPPTSDISLDEIEIDAPQPQVSRYLYNLT